MAAPIAPSFPIRSLADVRRLEETPLAQALPVRSTYEIFRNCAAAFRERTALTFLRSADPADTPVCWTYAELLAGIHQTANLLHTLGVTPGDAVAVLLPGCLEYHLALGGEAAGIVQPLNPLLTDEKLVSLMHAARAKVLIAWGAEEDSGYWSKAMRIRGHVPTLAAVLRVGGDGARIDGVLDFADARAAQPADRLVSRRSIEPADIAAYKSVTVIERMPLTNVGKIYKPALRAMAAAAAARGIVEAVCRKHGVPGERAGGARRRHARVGGAGRRGRAHRGRRASGARSAALPDPGHRGEVMRRTNRLPYRNLTSLVHPG